jgi:hypothetical protein
MDDKTFDTLRAHAAKWHNRAKEEVDINRKIKYNGMALAVQDVIICLLGGEPHDGVMV